jgi:hypothetical protein
MGCDSCTSKEGARFDSAFTVGFRRVRGALFLAFLLLMTAWTLPTAPRGTADVRALVAFAAPVTVLLFLLGFACLLSRRDVSRRAASDASETSKTGGAAPA